MRRWLRNKQGLPEGQGLREEQGEGGAEEPAKAPAPAATGPPPVALPQAAGSVPDDAMDGRTEVVRAVNRALAHLDVLEGPGLDVQRFRVSDGQTTIGRSSDCDITLPDPAISRVHAVLIADDKSIEIEHRSQTNETFVNGVRVEFRQSLAHGDQIQLADRVVLQLEAPLVKAQPREKTLRGAMEARVDLDARIEKDFVRDGSFLDVDVVDSYGLKQRESREDRVVVSFERFRAYIERKVQGRQGRVLNSNGDEVMAYFETADTALASARDLIRDLGDFNARENLLADDFKIRVGIHSGRSAVDLDSGIAYSPVLDGAGHLQKESQVDSLLLSNETYEGLSNRDGLRSVGASGKRGIEAWAPESDG